MSRQSRRVELGLTEDDIVKCFFLLDGKEEVLMQYLWRPNHH